MASEFYRTKVGSRTRGDRTIYNAGPRLFVVSSHSPFDFTKKKHAVLPFQSPAYCFRSLPASLSQYVPLPCLLSRSHSCGNRDYKVDERETRQQGEARAGGGVTGCEVRRRYVMEVVYVHAVCCSMSADTRYATRLSVELAIMGHDTVSA